MPTYRYRCSDCGNEFDQYQKFADEPLTVCPACDGAIRRVIQPVGVVFKGSGWYVTDSRPSSSSTNGKDGKDGKDAKNEKSDSASKSDTAESKSSSTEPSNAKQSDTKTSSGSKSTKAAAST
jgi:putative FmdB family regulatory protein